MTDGYKIKRVLIRPNGSENQIYPSVPATAISLNKNSIEFNTAGQTSQITATLTPTGSTSSITWSSSNTSIATVSSTGLVRCVTPGSCTITATTSNGLTATCSVSIPYVGPLRFTANTAGSTIKLQKSDSPASVTLETSTNGTTWSTYTMGSTITLSNVGDKVYWRNTSTTNTQFSTSGGTYQFVMTGSISANGDTNYLINKNSTTTMTNLCFVGLFRNCSALTTAPKLPATKLAYKCYRFMFFNCTNLKTAPSIPATTLLGEECCYSMFSGCSNLEQIPKFPATTLSNSCYNSMFNGCSKIKISRTYEPGTYTTPYRIPTSGTGTAGNYSLEGMFNRTGGTFTGTPSINTTYYTSNTVV